MFIKECCRFIYHLFVLFGFLFEIPLFGPFTTRRVSLLLAILTLLIDYRGTKELCALFQRKLLRKSIFLYLICFLFAIINVPMIDGNRLDTSYFEPWYIVYIFLYVIVFSIYSVKEFKNIKYFGYVLFTCFLLQALVVYASVLYAPIRLVVLQLFNSGFEEQYGRMVENGSRIMGIGLGFSTGSIICSTCGAFLTFMVIKRQLSFFMYFLTYAILVSMTFFIGRTGAALELLFIAFIFMTRPKFIFKYSLALIIILLLSLNVITDLISSSDVANGDMLIEWMTEIFTKEGRNSTLEGIHQHLPPFSSRFVLGTGVMQGRLPQGDYMYSDCGYVMIYSALGIIGAVIYYFANYYLYRSVFVNVTERLSRLFLLLLIFAAFLIEYKEPFMQKYAFSYIILTIGLFQLDSQYDKI